MDTVEKLEIPDVPLMTIEICDPAVGLEGWVCVHSIGREGSSGGIRCVGEVTKEEVQALARAMTYKYSFFGIPQGGAKAGLRVDYDVDPKRKAELVRAAARHLEPLVRRSTIWSPWTDMNFYGEDLRIFYAEMGRSFTPNPHFNSSCRTAISAFWSLEACLDFYGMKPSETRLTLEGFGSVATYLVPFLMKIGIKVVGVSTHLGTVTNSKGLDLPAIVKLRERYGSAWIDQKGDWKRLERDALFELDTDILVPCARVHSIGSDQARRTPARLLLPIANVPCTDEALSVLDTRGLDYIPDFVVNGGGVSGHIRDIDDPFGQILKSMLIRMFKVARSTETPVRKIAEEAANANFGRLVADAYTSTPVSSRVLKRISKFGFLPKILFGNSLQSYRESMYSNVEALFTPSARNSI